jgi:hypothetical protein
MEFYLLGAPSALMFVKKKKGLIEFEQHFRQEENRESLD